MNPATMPAVLARMTRGWRAVVRRLVGGGAAGPTAPPPAAPARAFMPWLLAGLAFLAIEVTYFQIEKPDRQLRSNFLGIGFGVNEPIQRAMAYQKIMDLRYTDPDILFVGDSSCGHNIIPHVVMTQTPGFKVVNMGIASNVGYNGYLALSEFMLKKNKNIKYIVLYNTPSGAPREKLWDYKELMGQDIYNNFVSRPHSWLQPPTLAARARVYNYVAYQGGTLKHLDAPLTPNIGYLMLTATDRVCNGWMRETDVEGDFPPEYVYRYIDPDRTTTVTDDWFFDYTSLRSRSWIEYVYQQYADLARARGVKLVVMYNPVPASSQTLFPKVFQFDKIEAALRRFAANNPDVHVVTSIDYWPDKMFSIFSHVSTLHSHQTSLRAGRVLKAAIAEDGIKPTRPPGFIEREAPPFADLNFAAPVCMFGWGEPEGADFVRRYIGTRDHAYLYTVVKPGKDYVVRVHFANVNSVTALRRLKLRANDGPVLAEVGRHWKGTYTIDYRLPREAVGEYLGWFRLELDIRTAPGEPADAEPPGKKIAISRVTVEPVDGPTAGGRP